jgi:hypothetical protein
MIETSRFAFVLRCAHSLPISLTIRFCGFGYGVVSTVRLRCSLSCSKICGGFSSTIAGLRVRSSLPSLLFVLPSRI